MGLLRRYFPKVALWTAAIGFGIWLNNYACPKKPKENQVDKLIEYIVKASPKKLITLDNGTEVALLSNIPGVRRPIGSSNVRYHIKVKGSVSFLDLNSDGFDSVADEYLIRMGAKEYLNCEGFTYDSKRDSSFKAVKANLKINGAIMDITSRLGLQ